MTDCQELQLAVLLIAAAAAPGVAFGSGSYARPCCGGSKQFHVPAHLGARCLTWLLHSATCKPLIAGLLRDVQLCGASCRNNMVAEACLVWVLDAAAAAAVLGSIYAWCRISYSYEWLCSWLAVVAALQLTRCRISCS